MSLETDVVSLVGDPAKALITQASRIEHQANALLEGLERAGLAVDDALSRLRADVGARDGRSAKSSVVRVEIDPANANSLRLLAALSHHEGVQRDTSLMAPLASSEIASTVKAASASRGKVKFFFARGKTKEKATSSLASLQQLLAWSAKNGIERHLQLAITRCEPPSWDGMQLYGDFQARPGSYYDAVAKAMGANPAQVEAEAFVDADIVRSAVVLAHLASRLIEAACW